MNAPAATSLMDRLKAETREHHTRAETKQLQGELVRGSIPNDRYAAWLGQMLLVHEALEGGLARAKAHPLIDLARRRPSHAANIRADLKNLGAAATPPPRPLPATTALSAAVERAAATPHSLFGMFYVLEGSMNGNRYIAMALRKGLAAGNGGGQGRVDHYLDPYGEAQRGIWTEFRAAADRIGASDRDIDLAVQGAAVMFDGIAAMSDELVVG